MDQRDMELPDWRIEGRIAVATCNAACYRALAQLRSDFRSLWDECRRSDEVSGVVVLLRGVVGDELNVMSPDADGDPRIGPLSCGVDKPVVLGLSGTIDADFFPLFREVSSIAASVCTVFRCLDIRANRLPRAIDLPLPSAERARLALLGSMSVQRAHEMGLVREVCDASRLEATAISVANRQILR